MNASGPQTLLFVLGMHRSGTSALCAALAACGASFGSDLIDPMAGVNDEGFWEDANVVALNEQLLGLLDSTWYAPGPGLHRADWSAVEFASLREQAATLLRNGFGDAPLQVVKDPRLCLTLPFWLSLCEDLNLAARVCVTGRAPLEIARSLEKRDGFPLGYGLRLFSFYQGCIERAAPAATVYVSYHELLRDAAAVMTQLAQVLPLTVTENRLAEAVRSDLRHHYSEHESDPLATISSGAPDLAVLGREIESRYPVDDALRDFAHTLVSRGKELDQIGAAHTTALATLDQRDADIAALSAEHRKALATLDERDADIAGLAEEHRLALATIDERDEQIREFDRRLSQLGEEHTQLLQTLEQRHAELDWIKQRLETINKIPGASLLIKKLRKHAQG
jgi:hypothetical protein